MSDLECPYCEHNCGSYFDDQHENNQMSHECEECGKTFIFLIEYDPSFYGHKADCLNGAEHDYKEICGCPSEYFLNRRRCSICSKDITLKEGDKGYVELSSNRNNTSTEDKE